MTRRTLLVLALCIPSATAAQGVRVFGSVVRERDGQSEPVAGALVVLHRMTDQEAAPVDSVATNPAGRYRFVRPAEDTTGRLIVTVRHDGVAYVSDEAGFTGSAGRIAPVSVYDTSSTTTVILAQRHLLVRARDPDGSRAVLELLILRNPGDRTRVAGAGSPSVRVRLAGGALDAVVPAGEGDMGAGAVTVTGDTLTVSAPLPPGDRQLVVTYLLPASRRLVLHVDQLLKEMVVMLADTAATMLHGSLDPGRILPFEGEQYLRLEGKELVPGDSLVVGLPPVPVRAGDLWWLVVLGSAGVLAAAAAKWWRRS